MFLVGFMGSGKNTVGQELARRLGWDFVDLDARIEQRERRTVPEIFAAKGESIFRQAETAALRDVLAESKDCNRVVALGGGAFAIEHNRVLLRDWPTVFLDAPVAELWRRCQQDDIERPLGKDRRQFSSLLAERLPLYRQAAFTIETSGKKLSWICSEIERALHLKEVPQSVEESL